VNTNILHKSFLIDGWQSPNPDDAVFGAKIDSLKEVLVGRNSLVLCIGRQNEMDLKIVTDLLASHRPTRVICIAPTEKISLVTQGSRNCLEIVKFEQGLPFIRSDTNTQVVIEPISIGLFMNRESLIFDALDWFAFKEELRDWATNLGIKYITPPFTDALFRERTFPKHSRGFPSYSSSDSLFHFFDGRREKTNELPHFTQAGISNTTAKLLAKINKHKPELSGLGILPNQLRTFLKKSGRCEEVLADLTQTLFWKGFELWKKRTALVAQFWKNCPEEWRNIKERKDSNARPCGSMFHFCSRVKNLSNQRRTLCFCSCITPDVDRESLPIVSRTKISRKRKTSSHSDIAVSPRYQQTTLFWTREDRVREDRDRDKRSKCI